MQAETDLTIVLLTYNRPEYLEGCIEKLAANMFPNLPCTWELIIMDDGSDDETTDIIKSTPHDVLIRNEHRDVTWGGAWVMNEAMRVARGRRIIHLEDDFHLIRPYTEDDYLASVEAFETIPHLGLIRYRDMNTGSSSTVTTKRYFKETERPFYNFRGRELGVFKRWAEDKSGTGGPSYQYTGNPHMRSREVWHTIGPYPEDKCIRGVENNYAGRYRATKFRSATFKQGWFLHIGAHSTEEQTKGRIPEKVPHVEIPEL